MRRIITVPKGKTSSTSTHQFMHSWSSVIVMYCYTKPQSLNATPAKISHIYKFLIYLIL